MYFFSLQEYFCHLRKFASSSFVMTRYARAKQARSDSLRLLPRKRYFIGVWSKFLRSDQKFSTCAALHADTAE